ncbi:uncharacterized protein STEHIDRAFT_161124 [Stereum hirsutum FP-91666 SS1]|uniref:uncharacterized protein n=1 Tax=Stereum hirsutum (strain FP-91666) TaxID=721885 RepID=UPI000444A55F|nr:uncharacterized protein STEHIDRAFT_161124 [Stereum hirsutum FP-91666 SS1]EIM82596.1 hypothetical protein STEHIDRAFT_161124 [Stereum hirsutum FP-91666 SS1]
MPATPIVIRREASPEELNIVTTTIYSGGASPTPSLTTESSSSSSQPSVPLAPIIGGVLGGVCLALIVVLGWSWWGSCIQRKEEEKRKEDMDRLAVRANTRRNASTFSAPISQYQPSSKLSSAGRKVKFAAAHAAPTSTPTNDQALTNEKNTSSPTLTKPLPTPPDDDSILAYNDNDIDDPNFSPSSTPPRRPSPPPTRSTPSSRYMLTRKPKAPSKLSWSTVVPPRSPSTSAITSTTALNSPASTPLTTPSPSTVAFTSSPFHDSHADTDSFSPSPLLPPPLAASASQPSTSNYSQSSQPQYSFLREIPGRSQQQSVRAPGSLVHKPSAVSSDSWYSTQSGEERRKVGPARRLFDGIMPKFDGNRLSTLSRNSGGSVYSTLD